MSGNNGSQGPSKRKEQEEESRSQAIGEFVNITQSDPSIAKHILEAHDWNIENAISYFLETGGVIETIDDACIDAGGADEHVAVQQRPSRQGRSRPIIVHDDDDVVCVDDDDDEDEDIRALASFRTRRTNQHVDYNEDTDEEEDYLDVHDEAYGEEEERFKYGRRSRRGNRRRLRRVQDVCPQPDETQVPVDVLNMPDVNIEEQKMLMAALTGEVYDGEIPDFSDAAVQAAYVPRPLSPGAIQRQILREEQDLALQESLERDREKERQRDLMHIGQMEREESAKREQEALEKRLEEKKRRLPIEPSPDDAETFMLVIRMPNGSRLKRRFSFKDSLQSAFDFIDVTDEAELVPGTYQLVSQVCIVIILLLLPWLFSILAMPCMVLTCIFVYVVSKEGL